jgi:hypothetical protein
MVRDGKIFIKYFIKFSLFDVLEVSTFSFLHSIHDENRNAINTEDGFFFDRGGN